MSYVSFDWTYGPDNTNRVRAHRGSIQGGDHQLFLVPEDKMDAILRDPLSGLQYCYAHHRPLLYSHAFPIEGVPEWVRRLSGNPK